MIFNVDETVNALYNITADVVRRLDSFSPEPGFTITIRDGARTSLSWSFFKIYLRRNSQ